MHSTAPFFILIIYLTISLTACSNINVEPEALQTAPPIPADAKPSPFRLSAIKNTIPRGAQIGAISPRDLGITCRGPYGEVSRSAIISHLNNNSIRLAFYDSMTSQGYDVTDNPARVFDVDDEYARSIYSIGAVITDIKADLCLKSSLLFGTSRGELGEATINVDWTIYDRLQKKTVLKTATKGYARTRIPNQEGIELLLDEAFSAAAFNLGADKNFHALMIFGAKPHSSPDTKSQDNIGRTGLFDPDEQVSIPPLPLSHNPALNRLEQIRNAAVLVESGAGHGSGFFITDQGHILTNAHVVGFADRVRIVSTGKKTKTTAEVLRTDRERDVALLKLEAIPDDLAITLLPVRTTIPKVGADIYAIGAPFSYKDLQDTVTKGIVSAYRKHDRWDKQSYIQGDVYVTGGNSGGPLIDENGNLIGLTVAGYKDGAQDLSGLNLFIPIGDALEKLSIGINAEPQHIIPLQSALPLKIMP